MVPSSGSPSVVPTEHLKTQWALAAAAVGIALDPKFSNSSSQMSSEYHGVVVTYAQVAATRPGTGYAPRTTARSSSSTRSTTAVDAKTWGEAMREAFTDATRRLALTGTPFRSDDSPIPFVTYEPDGGSDAVRASGSSPSLIRSVADHTYGYAEALADGRRAPRRVPGLFRRRGGATPRREVHAARLGEPLTGRADRPGVAHRVEPRAGEWNAAGDRGRRHPAASAASTVPDAGGMVIASDQAGARAYADLLTTILR